MKARGVDLGGVRIAIEVPSWFDWGVPEGGRHRICPASTAELYLGLRHLHRAPVIEHRVSYPCAEGTLEVGRSGSEWVLAVRDEYRFHRVAQFDSHFRQGELMLSQAAVASGACPISDPLGPCIAAHRAVLSGSLVVWGSAAVLDGRALVFLGDTQPAAIDRELARGWLVLRPGEPASVRVSSLTFLAGRLALHDVPLHAVHVSESLFGMGAVPDRLNHECAAGELLRYAFAPAGGAAVAEAMLATVGELAERIDVVRLGIARSRHFAWRPGPTGIKTSIALR